MKKILGLLLFTTLWLFAIPADIQYFLNKSKLPSSDVSIYIKDLDSNRVVASYNIDASKKPASVIKVLSTYAALLELGFEYRWPTEFYMNMGELIVKGYGDPSLSLEDIPEIVEALKDRGVRVISGDIVIDRSYFDVGDKDSSYFDNNPYSPYNAMPDAMMFDERTSTVCITPGRGSIEKEIEDHSYQVVNKLRFVNRACSGKYAWAASNVDLKGETPKLVLKGDLSRHCTERKVCLIVTKPYKAFYYALKEELAKQGIAFSGSLRVAKVPADSKLVYTHYAKPLEELVSTTAKDSNNVYARHLLLNLGAKIYGAPATLEKGRKAVEGILRKHGALGSGNLVIDNGSGLSRKSRLSARHLSDVLQNAYGTYGQRWLETLSIAGIDGTVKRRYRYSPAHGRAWMKTGTLNRVKNIAGYVKSKSGKYYSVVVLVNTSQGTWKGAQLQDDIINWLAKTSATSSSFSDDTSTKKSVYQDIPAPSKREKPAKASKPVKEVKAKPIHTASAKGRYYIQVASVSSKPSDRFLGLIRNAGYNYDVVPSGQGYRVYIGGYASKSEAQRALPQVRQRFAKGAFIVTR